MSKLGDDLVSRICTQFERGLLWAATKHDRRAEVAPKLGREIVAIINVALDGVAAICGENTGRIVDKIGVLTERIGDCEDSLTRIEALLLEIKQRQEPGNGHRY